MKREPEKIGVSVSLSPRLAKLMQERTSMVGAMGAIEKLAFDAFRKMVIEEGIDLSKWRPVLTSIEPVEGQPHYNVNFRFEPKP